MGHHTYELLLEQNIDSCHSFFRQAMANMSLEIKKDNAFKHELIAIGIVHGTQSEYKISLTKRGKDKTVAKIMITRMVFIERNSREKSDKCMTALKSQYDEASKKPSLSPTSNLSIQALKEESTVQSVPGRFKNQPYDKLIRDIGVELNSVNDDLNRTKKFDTLKLRRMRKTLDNIISRLQAACDQIAIQNLDTVMRVKYEQLEELLSQAKKLKENVMKKNLIDRLYDPTSPFHTGSEILDRIINIIQLLIVFATEARKLLSPPGS